MGYIERYLDHVQEEVPEDTWRRTRNDIERARHLVEQGAEVLSEHMPGWVEKIDLDTLEMASCSKCILGQIHGDFYAGWEILEREAGKEYLPCFDAVDASSYAMTVAYLEYLTGERFEEQSTGFDYSHKVS